MREVDPGFFSPPTVVFGITLTCVNTERAPRCPDCGATLSTRRDVIRDATVRISRCLDCGRINVRAYTQAHVDSLGMSKPPRTQPPPSSPSS